MDQCGCSSAKVTARCIDTRLVFSVIADADGAVLVDDALTAFMVGATRTGATAEFEFNRQLPPEP